MLSLTSKLDSTVDTIAGEFPIDLCFNNVLKWYEMIERDDMESAQKIRAGWFIFLGADNNNFETTDDYELAVDALGSISEYISQDPYVNKSESGEEQSNIEPTKWFSYKEDAEAIYASFLFDFNIDLIDQQDKLRWEKFRALFNNLSAKSPIMRIIDIRQSNPSEYEGKARTDLMQAQEYYSLESLSVDNLNNSIGDMFSMLKGMATQND